MRYQTYQKHDIDLERMKFLMLQDTMGILKVTNARTIADVLNVSPTLEIP